MNLIDQQAEEFIPRHIGTIGDEKEMLETIGEESLEVLINKTIPESIRLNARLAVPDAISENDYMALVKDMSLKNILYKSFIGQGYYGTITPSVILRNVFENPGWYTQYTPYQAEISQGRLESLLNFQTMVSDLTGLPIANASLLDEATAAAEAMAMLFHHVNKTDTITRPRFFVDEAIFPQTIDVLHTRALPIGIELVHGDFKSATIDDTFFGALVQYPNNKGSVEDYTDFIEQMHAKNIYVVMATDLLALTLLKSPGELKADVAVGSAQRFGVPLGYGGPHAAFFATQGEFKRGIPGRIIGVSIDAQENRALRMALQTREQHIKREKATSNICTAQALLANMAAMYAVFHGPEGLKNMATRIHLMTAALSKCLETAGINLSNQFFFDTLHISGVNGTLVKSMAEKHHLNFRYFPDGSVGISLDETTSLEDVNTISNVFELATKKNTPGVSKDVLEEKNLVIQFELLRNTPYLTHPVFNIHHSETQMMRYLKQLENKDLSLNTSMISLGSCTMKLNAASEMIPVSWSHWANMHPFAPLSQCEGYTLLVEQLSDYLCQITGFAACSLQPNSGAQGEFAGLNTIMGFHKSKGHTHRDVVLIPISAHGTNPASAILAGMKVVVIKSDAGGYIDVDDLKAKAEKHKDNLAGLMVTYPSTHGVFEESIKDICKIIHSNGGLVYMDGANMNAQVGLTSPANIGADVCHLNLHKTFSIPHGGGGPGMGPICCTEALKPFLPGHVFLEEKNDQAASAISAAPYGSASILLISYGYIRMLGEKGIRMATEYAILNANYMKARLEKYYKILFTGKNGTCAHEFIVDLRPFKQSAGIEAEDVAKRLIDYGFHAPTMSFPVPGTIMIEPTESEDKAELDRFCDAMIGIYEEIKDIEENKVDRKDNVLKNAPHTQAIVCADEWYHPYSRQSAAFPIFYVSQNKFWPAVARINNTFGDRNLICTCEPMESYEE